jgi:hypothetical protein
MPYYRCLIRGENFAWPNGGDWDLMGFYTTRWVQALNPAAAETKAVEALSKEPEFKKPEGYCSGPPARVCVEEIDNVKRLPLMRGRGATWFAMEDD